ncbi:hypothetical protein CSAL01_10665 [Colletotrichum salicis]|uniref:Uncharacterized protein n=1 Tax=Colletotrichum salicis TaxID=1209931 RepID=A0A135RU66_9PEZI|nr:hypothetical protein CSAL01_10665 [Colletotrichum salicis]
MREDSRVEEGFRAAHWSQTHPSTESNAFCLTAARRILTRFLPVNRWSWRLRVETEVADDTSATAAALMYVPSHRRLKHAYVADFGRTWTLVVPRRPDPLRPSEAFGALIHYGILALVSDVPSTSGLGPALHQSIVSSSNTLALPYDIKERKRA